MGVFILTFLLICAIINGYLRICVGNYFKQRQIHKKPNH